MPPENVPVIKRTSFEVIKLQNLKESEINVRNGFFLKSHLLPYQRQEPPFTPIRSSRSVEKNVFRNELNTQEIRTEEIGKYNTIMTAKYAKITIENKTMVKKIQALQLENDRLRRVIIPLAELAIKDSKSN